MAYLNNIIDDFYNGLTNIGNNGLVLIILILIVLVYYVIFSFLGVSNNDSNEKSGLLVFFQSILFGIAILLIFLYAISYFYNINFFTEVKNLFNDNPEINIKSIKNNDLSNNDLSNNDLSNNDLSGNNTLIQEPPIDLEKEVFHIPGSKFTYHDAKAVCKAFNSELATYNNIKNAQQKGANWCSYGWSHDKLALYPTSDSAFKKIQETEEENNKYKCGLPGINGGYLNNPYIKLGANCYGVKPFKSELEKQNLDDSNNIPKSEKELLFNERTKYWKDRIGNILIYPFNRDKWYMIGNQNIYSEKDKSEKDKKN